LGKRQFKRISTESDAREGHRDSFFFISFHSFVRLEGAKVLNRSTVSEVGLTITEQLEEFMEGATSADQT